MNTLTQYWPYLVGLVLLLLFVYIKIKDRRSLKRFVKNRVMPYVAEHKWEVCIAIGFILIVITLSFVGDKWLWGPLCNFYDKNSPPPFGIILTIFGVLATTFGVLLSLRIFRTLSTPIHDFNRLVKMINCELEEYKLNRDEMSRIKPRPYLYIYAATPSLGNISSERAYNVLEGRLEALLRNNFEIRAICFPLGKFTDFHKRLKGLDQSDSADTDVNKWNKSALRLVLNIVRSPYGKVLISPVIFNSFLVITPHTAYEFMIQRVEGNGHNELVGRIIRQSSDVRFMKKAFEQFWKDQNEAGQHEVKIENNALIDGLSKSISIPDNQWQNE